MKDQREQIRDALVKAVKSEVAANIKGGKTQQEIAKKVGVDRTFITHLMNDNEAGLHGLAIPKLIKVANGLGLDVEMIIRKNGERIK